MDCIDYLRQLPTNSVDLVVTDPPYNVSQKDLTFWGKPIQKDFGSWDYGFDPKQFLKELKRVLKPTGQIYVFCGTKQVPEYMKIFFDDWFFRNILVWSRTNPPPRVSKTNWLFANDYVIYAINDQVKLNTVTFNFTASQSDMKNLFITPSLWGKERLKQASGKAFHPTQKPLEILKKIILASSNKGDVVLDPFMGVGSTAVAALQTGRNFLGCDFDPKYVRAAKNRISSLKAHHNQ